MPEGPEYALTAKEFAKYFDDTNAIITDIYVQKNTKTNDELINKIKTKLIGKEFVEAISHGKSLFIVCKKENNYAILHSKFGLHGYWTIESRIDAEQDYTSYVKLAITFDDSTIAVYHDPTNFGNKYIISYKEMLKELLETADPIKEDITKAKLIELLTHGRIKNKPIAKLLLDQSIIVGIGNYLRAEILHNAKLHPLTPANQIVNDAKKLNQLLIAINKIPIKIFSKLEQHKPESEIFKVYQREKTPNGKEVTFVTIDKRKCYFVGELRSPTAP